MTNPFTLRRWRFQQWQMYLLLGVFYASIWQIVDNHAPERWGIALANLGGSGIALLALHLKDKELSRIIERWAYIALVWSMSCYLALALEDQGWRGVVHQPNLGVVAAEAIILAALHRTLYTLVCKRVYRYKVKVRAARLLAELPDTAGPRSAP
jgi:hypothetical protein